MRKETERKDSYKLSTDPREGADAWSANRLKRNVHNSWFTSDLHRGLALQNSSTGPQNDADDGGYNDHKHQSAQQDNRNVVRFRAGFTTWWKRMVVKNGDLRVERERFESREREI